jgi:hypothetical protein
VVLVDPAARRHAPVLARLDALERWARTLPHKQWWGRFLRDSAGTGIWQETYFLRGGIEAIYGDVPGTAGTTRLRPGKTGDRGHVLRSPTRKLEGQELAPVIPEAELDQRSRNAEPPTKRDSAAGGR